MNFWTLWMCWWFKMTVKCRQKKIIIPIYKWARRLKEIRYTAQSSNNNGLIYWALTVCQAPHWVSVYPYPLPTVTLGVTSHFTVGQTEEHRGEGILSTAPRWWVTELSFESRERVHVEALFRTSPLNCPSWRSLVQSLQSWTRPRCRF